MKQEKLLAPYRRAYEATPGLEQFDRRKRGLLWGMFGFAVAQKLLALLAMSGGPLPALLIGALVGLCIPGIFALAAYRTAWKFSLIFFLLAAYLLYDVVANGLPALLSGVRYLPLFYVMMALESIYVIYLLAMAAWLTIPAQNRRYAQLLNDAFQECRREMRSPDDTRRL